MTRIVPAVIGPGTTTAPGYVVDLDLLENHFLYEKKMRPLKPSGRAKSNGVPHDRYRIQLGRNEHGKRRTPQPYARVLLASATGFMPPPHIFCCHLDGNPYNNALSNLAWGTASENALDAAWHKKHPGTIRPNRKVWTP